MTRLVAIPNRSGGKSYDYSKIGKVRWQFDYVNHKNVDEKRVVIPHSFTFRALRPWYPEPTWLMRGYDLVRMDYRDFQCTKIRNLEELKL